ncbi:phosphatidate phosphatase [Blomia tropicalis]|nr:phosphatidate phosphatase [Blomia tropicalis]
MDQPSETIYSPSSTSVYIVSRPTIKVLVRKIVLDIGVLLILGLFILFINLYGIPFQRGFNCNDDSIRYPFKDDTINTTSLILYSLLIPFITIVTNELFVTKNCLEEDGDEVWYRKRHYWACFTMQVYIQLIQFLFAVAMSQSITDISKYSIGRLRPNFMDLCQPQVKSQTKPMDRFSKCENPYEYITEYKCTTNHDQWILKDVHLSFMSGHSSLSAVCLIYLVLYLQNRVQKTWLTPLKNLYQAGLIFLVIYTGLSRISDYKHHWSDVLTGLIQGTLVAIIVSIYVSDLIQTRTRYKRQSDNEINLYP